MGPAQQLIRLCAFNVFSLSAETCEVIFRIVSDFESYVGASPYNMCVLLSIKALSHASVKQLAIFTRTGLGHRDALTTTLTTQSKVVPK